MVFQGCFKEFFKKFQLPRVFQKVQGYFTKVSRELFNNNDIYFRTKCLQKYNYNIEKRHINPRPEKKCEKGSRIRPKDKSLFYQGSIPAKDSRKLTS